MKRPESSNQIWPPHSPEERKKIQDAQNHLLACAEHYRILCVANADPDTKAAAALAVREAFERLSECGGELGEAIAIPLRSQM